MREKNVRHKESFYGENLAAWAELFAKTIPPQVTHLVCGGSSGMAIAAAVTTIRKGLNICYVYPKGYVGLRGKTRAYSGEMPIYDAKWVIVDDFIDIGGTVLGIMERLKVYSRELCPPAAFVMGSDCYGRISGARKIAKKFRAPVLYANGKPPTLPTKV